MNVLLDTHFLLWAVMGADRLQGFPWLNAYRPWGISPVSFLEIQFLAEVGRLEVHQPGFSRAVAADPRFVIDEVPLVALVEKAIPLSWTRDPFDRLLAAHSHARRVPLCSLDRRIRAGHRLLVEELRS
ncbi:type II toxin-antitoxin system VapC family toxin [Gemmatimonadota bacterium]